MQLTRRILLGLGGLILIAAVSGAAYQADSAPHHARARATARSRGRPRPAGARRSIDRRPLCTRLRLRASRARGGTRPRRCVARGSADGDSGDRPARTRTRVVQCRTQGVTFGPTPPSSAPPPLQRAARATAFRTSAYTTTANEGMHLPQSADEVRATRHRLTIPVVVVSAGLDADTAWQRLQRDQVALSARGCQIIAERSGHAIAQGQPSAIVAPIRALVRNLREGTDAPLCE